MPVVDNRALSSDVEDGQQEILEDEPLFRGKLHAKGWKAVGSYWSIDYVSLPAGRIHLNMFLISISNSIPRSSICMCTPASLLPLN